MLFQSWASIFVNNINASHLVTSKNINIVEIAMGLEYEEARKESIELKSHLGSVRNQVIINIHEQ